MYTINRFLSTKTDPNTDKMLVKILPKGLPTAKSFWVPLESLNKAALEQLQIEKPPTAKTKSKPKYHVSTIECVQNLFM